MLHLSWMNKQHLCLGAIQTLFHGAAGLLGLSQIQLVLQSAGFYIQSVGR